MCRFVVLTLFLAMPFGAHAGELERRCAAPDDWTGRLAACSEILATRAAPRALARAHLHRGEAHLALGATLESVRDLREAARLAPGMAAPRLVLGVAYLELGRVDEALAEFGAAADLAPHAPEVWYWRALAEDRLGRPEAALADLDRALDRDPAHAGARLARARLRCALGLVEGAVQDTVSALSAGQLDRARLTVHLAEQLPAADRGGDPLGADRLHRWARAGCP